MNQANFLFGYEVTTMIIILVTTKENSLGTNFNQQNWMLVFRLLFGGKSIEISWEVLELNANVSKVLEGHHVKKCAF